jgi:ribosome small subunit-dependent GTPase A
VCWATERNQNRSDRRECTSAESTHNLFVSLASRGIARGGAIALRQRRGGKSKGDIYQLYAPACHISAFRCARRAQQSRSIPSRRSQEAEVESIAIGAAVVRLSAGRGEGIESLDPWLVPGHTLALLGSSGVGKSTLINRLLGIDHMATRAISDAVGKGRHTTTHRELIVTPAGTLVIDTPGMRELQLWDVETSAIDTAFADIAAIAARCRFRDCHHNAEPGCAINLSLDDGSLEFDRWQSYQKLQREQAYAARRESPRLERETRNDWKKIHNRPGQSCG